MTTMLTTHSERETAEAGRDLAATLSVGDVVLLYGELGAGKTAFVRGLAEGLGVAPGDVSSPTFTLVQEYRGGRVPLFHVDLYRLNDPREIDDLGLDEMGTEGVLAIEWADRLPNGWTGSIDVRLAHGEDDTRHLAIHQSVDQSPNRQITKSPDHSDR
jgi:tRNA threonylcarbamoyladenosine biosynthesis protein TsaE